MSRSARALAHRLRCILGVAGRADRTVARTDGPSPDPWPVRRFLDLSTAHVPQPMLLDLGEQPGVVADPTPFGAWLWVPSDPEDALDFDPPPPEVLVVQCFARSLGCDYVLLDSDGPTVAALPTFDWT